ncbi:response regulator [Myxococcota bacterium]|nr:response regulator [Myxococcota bacterium]
MNTDDGDLINVLVIDDDPEVREILTRILLRAGHQVVPTESAEKGLELLPYYTFQVALLDHHLPGMEGLVLGEYLRRNNPSMKIALVTGEVGDELVRFAAEHDITVIAKPFEVTQILDLVTAYQREAAARDAEAAATSDVDWAPPLDRHLDGLAEVFDIPNVPKRIEDRLVYTVKRSLNVLATNATFDERERVVALAGLVTLMVLGIRPAKASSGRTLFEEYDALMLEHRRRPEFGSVRSEPPDEPT